MGVSQTPQMIAHQFLGTCNSDTRTGKRERLHQSLGRILVCTKLQCQLGTVAANKKCAPNMGVPLMSTIAPGTFQDDVYFVKKCSNLEPKLRSTYAHARLSRYLGRLMCVGTNTTYETVRDDQGQEGHLEVSE